MLNNSDNKNKKNYFNNCFFFFLMLSANSPWWALIWGRTLCSSSKDFLWYSACTSISCTASQKPSRGSGECTSMQEFTHGTQKRHLLSGSSLHSRFLWPQNCTCLLTADPSERSKRILSGFMKKLQLLFVLKLVFMSRQQILIYNIINNLHIITLLQITSLKTHFNKKSCFFVFLTLWYFCHDERRI